MELSSFEFGLCLFLPIYSRTIVIDRYGIFIALEEDVYELGVMSKFFTGMKMIFASVPQLHEVFFSEISFIPTFDFISNWLLSALN